MEKCTYYHRKKNLYNLGKTKKLSNDFKSVGNKYFLISIPKLVSIPYSHKYGYPKYDWHRNKLELDAILPFYFGKKLLKMKYELFNLSMIISGCSTN